MVKILELSQDRTLIKTNFDGYKLSLQSVPIIRQNLISNPILQKPSEAQYSFLHAELFSLQNLLVQDPWDRNSSYFIAQNGNILKCEYNEESGRPNKQQAVIKLQKNLLTSSPGDYNFSFQFVSEKFCVLCDGKQHCILFDTGDRYKTCEWKEIFRCKISEKCTNFILKDCRLDTIDGNKSINCIFQHINYNGSSYITELFWCILRKNETNWNFDHKDILSAKGSIQYCGLEPRAAALVIASNAPFHFESVVQDPDTMKDVKEPMEEIDMNFKTENKYSWYQNNEDIIISIYFGQNIEKNDYKIQSTSDKIIVEYANTTLIDGLLFAKVDPDLTIWTWEKDHLKITLIKENPNNFWQYLIENGPAETGNFCNDKLIPNLEVPLENCDFSINSDEEYFIERLELSSKETTHKILLGNAGPLFSTKLRPGFPPAVVTRHDFDASIWLQKFNPIKPNEWCFRHEANLHAFGYIQASKQQKKFINCAPDLSYSVICESHRHVFIYQPNNESASGLRNRNGTQIMIGKQSLVTLEDAGEVLGMECSTNVITLLTEKCILYLQINI